MRGELNLNRVLTGEENLFRDMYLACDFSDSLFGDSDGNS